MAQDGGTGGGAFHGEMYRCRESQGWTTACRSMPERDGQHQGEDSPKQAGSCWFACHSWLATSGANLYPPGACRVVFLWCYFFFFRHHRLRPLSSLFRLHFVSLEMSRFPSFFLVPLPFSRCMESTSYVSPSRMVFSYFWPQAGFFTSSVYAIIQSN